MEHDITSNRVPLGVCILPPPPRNVGRTVRYPQYVHEILAHAGLGYASLTLEELPERLSGLKLLLTVGDGALPAALAERLRTWVEEGGAWVAVAGVCGLADLFGVEVELPAYSSWGGGMGLLGEGYLEAATPDSPDGSIHIALAHLRIPLHFFNGVPVRALNESATVLARVLDAHGRAGPRAALTERAVGAGCCLLIAPDLPGSVVHIQQGRAVTRDGFPAPDGTSPVCDDVLKSDDGAVLDWLLDRRPVEGAPGFSAFLDPIADQWRELLLRALLYLAGRQQIPLPLLWLYPRNLPALGHLSHDTDGNGPAQAERLLEILWSAGVRSTWCVILPGYPPDLMAAIREAGHELAMHYDAMTDGLDWGEPEFDRQWRELTALFGGERPTSNKNHYLRWEGDADLWDWCARRGIRLDQSKGASKTGEAGFNFGTCHPHFPLAPDGATLDVLEMPTPTQDLEVFAPVALLGPLLEAVEHHHGVLHLLFHPAHIDRPEVVTALLDAVERAAQRGLEWWTAQEIDTWERARRTVSWTGFAHGEGSARASLRADTPLPGATVLWLAPGDAVVRVNGVECESQACDRWGFSFQAVVLDLMAGEDYRVEIGNGAALNPPEAGR